MIFTGDALCGEFGRRVGERFLAGEGKGVSSSALFRFFEGVLGRLGRVKSLPARFVGEEGKRDGRGNWRAECMYVRWLNVLHSWNSEWSENWMNEMGNSYRNS